MVTLAKIRENFLWRIEAITPSERNDLKPFQRLVRDIDPMDESGFIRLFTVEWMASSEDLDLTCGESRQAEHIFGLTVYYASSLKLDDLQELILSDRNDIIEALRIGAGDTRRGYSDAHPTDDIGMELRERVRDEIAQLDNNVYAYKATWRVIAQEEV